MSLEPPAEPPSDTSANLDSAFWENRYQEGTTRWDLGQPAPAFVDLLNSVDAPKPGRMAVLGAGRGHDALLFAAHGFEVVGFDFAPSAIATATAAARTRGLTAQFLQRNIFDLKTEFAASFDYVLEHTCFCAIAPNQRSDYVQLVQGLLRPAGELIAIFWAHSRAGGPPFGATVDEIQQLFQSQFELRSLTPLTNSPLHRQQEELLARFRVKPPS